MGEEWRRGWHPEIINPKDTEDTVLVIGAGPAGLEAARALGQRGYEVTLAEAGSELGGRVARESRLPGLATWARVKDWRIGQLTKLPNVSVYLGSAMGPDDVLEARPSLVAVATGALWRSDGIGRYHSFPIEGCEKANVYTPDDVMNGRVPQHGPVLIFDDDHYYMGGVLAERLVTAGLEVLLATPQSVVSSFTQFTLEQGRIQARLMKLGVRIFANTTVSRLHVNGADLVCVYSGTLQEVTCQSVVLVTSQTSQDELFVALQRVPERLRDAGIRHLVRIGDCDSPGTIAAAVYQGHRFARELDTALSDSVPFLRENVELGPLSPAKLSRLVAAGASSRSDR